jgi:hypothetical protein
MGLIVAWKMGLVVLGLGGPLVVLLGWLWSCG